MTPSSHTDNLFTKVRTERALAQAISLLYQLERNDTPDDLQLAELREEWLIAWRESRQLKQQHGTTNPSQPAHTTRRK